LDHGGKQFLHWAENKRSKEMVSFYESKISSATISQSKSTGDDPKVCVENGSNTLPKPSIGIPMDDFSQSKVLTKILGGYGPEDEFIRGF
jgi:hypothetical protein